MELEVGPFDPALHIRSRDHIEAVRREAQLLSLAPEAAPARLEELVVRLTQQFPRSPVDDVVDQAYLAGQPSFSARYTLPDELVPAALDACDQLEDMLDEIDRWVEAESVQLLEAPDDIKRYRKAYLDQVRVQLKVADGG
ncbi:MAG TPA: hypothetical protein VG411_15880 [Actinomycetota bacterium]|nr:hypothetical protein [Actinomycetota bacterium]